MRNIKCCFHCPVPNIFLSWARVLHGSNLSPLTKISFCWPVWYTHSCNWEIRAIEMNAYQVGWAAKIAIVLTEHDMPFDAQCKTYNFSSWWLYHRVVWKWWCSGSFWFITYWNASPMMMNSCLSSTSILSIWVVVDTSTPFVHVVFSQTTESPALKDFSLSPHFWGKQKLQHSPATSERSSLVTKISFSSNKMFKTSVLHALYF